MAEIRDPREVIKRDLAEGGKFANRPAGDRIRTRFPPEPNGYLHIGHAKSICLNFGLANQHDGRCHLRFDDTNPGTEELEYVLSIQEDVKWLGFDWGEHLYFASSYFDTLYEYAIHLIKNGKAYVDSQSPEEMKKTRGNVTTPGTNSPFRERSVEENLALFVEMKDGKYKEGEHVLRAKIDMKSSNMNMRDPPIYRIMHKSHHATGDKWCIYPLYDFAHGQEDAIEGITHSICTLEFELHRELYNWFTENLPVPCKPIQYEFARLNLTNTVMSKRKLLKLVQEKVVSGWDDPRMPTICGMRRRGVRPEALRTFCEKIGVSTNLSTIDVALLEDVIRDDLDSIVERRYVVLDPIKLTITDFDATEEIDVPNHPVNDMGTRKMKFTGNVYIDREDFREDPPADYRRLKPDGECKLLRAGMVVKVVEVVKEGDKVVELKCTHSREPEKLKATKGAVHWVSADHSVDCHVRCYNYLLKQDNQVEDTPEATPQPSEEEEEVEKDFMSQINPNSIVEYSAKAELSVADAKPFDRFQFERNAFFVVDKDSTPGNIVFNRTIALKESGLKKSENKDAAARSRKDEQARQAAEKDAKKKLAPQDMFRSETDKYSKFDEDGVPTHDAAGEPLSKSGIKKLRKDWDKQKKLFESNK